MDNQNEIKILDAAKAVFLAKGKAGAGMQEIADKAGVNKSLLHYYYRSKDKLFNAVFEDAFTNIFPRISKILNEEEDIFLLIEKFTDAYFNIISENPFVPMFILNELSVNDISNFANIVDFEKLNTEKVFMKIKHEQNKGRIKDINPEHLIISVLSLILFPFIARPLAQAVLFKNDEKQYDIFLAERKEEVKKMIFNYIKP